MSRLSKIATDLNSRKIVSYWAIDCIRSWESGCMGTKRRMNKRQKRNRRRKINKKRKRSRNKKKRKRRNKRIK